MIAIDSNIFLRFFLPSDYEDPDVEVSHNFVFEQVSLGEKIFISLIVLVESCWVLKTRYKISEKQIITSFLDATEEIHFEFEDIYVLRNAIDLALKTSADFSDCLILETNKRNGAKETFSFDKIAAKKIGFKLPKLKK